MRETLEALLVHVYLPAMREKVDAKLRWSERDGHVLIHGEQGYEAFTSLTRDSGGWVLGRLLLDYRVIALASPAELVRYVRRQVDGLCDEYRDYLLAGAV